MVEYRVEVGDGETNIVVVLNVVSWTVDVVVGSLEDVETTVDVGLTVNDELTTETLPLLWVGFRATLRFKVFANCDLRGPPETVTE